MAAGLCGESDGFLSRKHYDNVAPTYLTLYRLRKVLHHFIAKGKSHFNYFMGEIFRILVIFDLILPNPMQDVRNL